MKLRTARIIERLNALGEISDSKNCISRAYGTKAHTASGNLLIKWMQNISLQTYRDAIGNIRCILPSLNPNAKYFIIGSHYDTVFNAGKYDGPLGILLGLEVMQYISENNIQLPFHLSTIAFADEEGARYNTAYLGSSTISGHFDRCWLNRTDDHGVSLKEVLEANGGQVVNIDSDSIAREQLLGYFEPHIEQGPVLCNEDLSVCLVNGIASQTRVDVHWTGINGHAGTYPMNHRNDAFCAASEFSLAVEQIGKYNSDKLVATIGKLNIMPNTPNVIPGKVEHTLDIRSKDSSFLVEISRTLEDKAIEISKKRKIGLEWNILHSTPSVQCDEGLNQLIRNGMKKAGIHKTLEIPSGAGHDAVMISRIAPVSMLFIRCQEGISHNPLEYVTSEDIEKSLEVCDNFVHELIHQNS